MYVRKESLNLFSKLLKLPLSCFKASLFVLKHSTPFQLFPRFSVDLLVPVHGGGDAASERAHGHQVVERVEGDGRDAALGVVLVHALGRVEVPHLEEGRRPGGGAWASETNIIKALKYHTSRKMVGGHGLWK